MTKSHYILHSPAKINTTLTIREYCPIKKKHRLESNMLCIPKLHDVIEITVVEKKKIQITVEGKYAKGVPNNENNLIFKAMMQFFTNRPKNKGFEITLTKNIPNGAGLGGGSSNAASIILFLHEYYSVPLDLLEYADLGSDIPFFLSQKSSALVSGFGEVVDATESIYTDLFGIILLFPQFPISTQWAFAQLRNRREQNPAHEMNYKNDFQELIFSYFYDIEKICNEIQKQKPLITSYSFYPKLLLYLSKFYI